MKKFILIAGICFMSGMVQAQITDTPCANGAGVIVNGSVTGKTYCKSNAYGMTWWNAYAWCDAIGMQMIDASDCLCSGGTMDCTKKQCPEFTSTSNLNTTFWTTLTNEQAGEMYTVQYGELWPTSYGNNVRNVGNRGYALCK